MVLHRQYGPLYSIWPQYRRVAIVTLCKTCPDDRAGFWDNVSMDKPIPLPELEQAINYWRNRLPSQGEESRLCAEAAALATPYALMIIGHRRENAPAEHSPAAMAAYRGWRAAHGAE